MIGTISYSTNFIIGTEEYKSQIDSNFFKDYIDKNICFEDHSNSHYFIYYCKINEFNQTDIDKFPTLKFYHYQYNYTFSFNGSELFLESNGYYYFKIIFDRYDYRIWTFGKLFLKKYQLVFNHDSKMISFYIDNKEGKGKNNNDNLYKIQNKNLIIIILVLIGIISFVIGIFIGSYVYGKKKKKKANEMKGDYFYKANESLNDSGNYYESKTIDTINN